MHKSQAWEFSERSSSFGKRFMDLFSTIDIRSPARFSQHLVIP
jgi:hypothetical protein